jgi:hypothetical protein
MIADHLAAGHTCCRRELLRVRPVCGSDAAEAHPAHDWSDEECITILSRCREALVPGGRIVVVDMIIGEENPIAALVDMNMFIACTGRERSLKEFDALFKEAGLTRRAVHQTSTPQSVIEVGHADA